MFSKKQGRKKRQWQCRIVGGEVDNICRADFGIIWSRIAKAVMGLVGPKINIPSVIFYLTTN